MSAPPTIFQYDGDGIMRALRPKAADRVFVVGEKYLLEEVFGRSASSHNHQFAWLADAWANLPEHLADQFPSPDHLRKACLIDAGFYNETILDAGSNAAALRVAGQMRSDDEFARVVVRRQIVVRRTAKTQRKNGMAPRDFQAAKTAIMEIVAGMLGVEPRTLEREAGRVA